MDNKVIIFCEIEHTEKSENQLNDCEEPKGLLFWKAQVAPSLYFLPNKVIDFSLSCILVHDVVHLVRVMYASLFSQKKI